MEKRNFVFFGLLNVVITNAILQVLLLIVSTSMATFIYQVTSVLLGYNIYAKKVFKKKTLTASSLYKYVLMSIIIWFINWYLIDLLYSLNIHKNISAIILIPFLATVSYIFQKTFVFSK